MNHFANLVKNGQENIASSKLFGGFQIIDFGELCIFGETSSTQRQNNNQLLEVYAKSCQSVFMKYSSM